MTKKFEFDEKNHYYTLDGKRLYGVTSVLGVIAKPALIYWAVNETISFIQKNLLERILKFPLPPQEEFEIFWKEAKEAHRQKKEDAGDIGKETHKAIEEWIKDKKEPKLDKLGMQMFNNFKGWAEKNKVKFLASEAQIYSESMWIAGTVDFVCEIDGKKYVGDIKTSSRIHDRVPFLQCAGYKLMLKEMGVKDIVGSCIIRLGKDGSFEEKYSYDQEGDEEGFLAALKLFKVIEAYNVKK